MQVRVDQILPSVLWIPVPVLSVVEQSCCEKVKKSRSASVMLLMLIGHKQANCADSSSGMEACPPYLLR